MVALLWPAASRGRAWPPSNLPAPSAAQVGLPDGVRTQGPAVLASWVDVFYPGFSKAFDTTRCGPDKRCARWVGNGLPGRAEGGGK